MSMTCSKCEFVSTSPTTCVHSKNCEDYQSGITAEQLKERLEDVQLFMHSDLVLMLKPKNEQVRKPEVVGVGSFDDVNQPNYVVKWFYPGVTLQFERANFDHPEYGKVSVYAVQKIEENNYVKKTKQKSRAGVSRRAVKRNRNSGN